jgi:hypothetical protein
MMVTPMQDRSTHPQRTLPPRLHEALREEILLAGEILSLLNQEQEALVRLDMPALLELCARKEEQVARMQGLDGQVQEITAAFAGLPAASPVRLRDLLPSLAPDEGARLEQQRLQLAGLREQILERSLVHKNFVEESRAFFNDAIAAVLSSVADRPMYGRSKAFSKPSVSLPSFVSREV